MSDTPPTVLTPDDVRLVLLEFFPGAEITTTKRIGGTTVGMLIWRWRFRVLLTTEELSAASKPGVATFLVDVLNNDAPSISQQMLDHADSVKELRAVVQRHHGNLMGIVAAIETACSPPVEPRPPSIFDDPPEPPAE